MSSRPRLGILGGGQLGRMLAAAAKPLHIATVVVDLDPSCPAAAVADDHLAAPFTDEAALTALASRVDVVTVEIEHVNASALMRLEGGGTGGPVVHPAAATVALIQDKLAQKEAMAAAGVPCGDFRAVANVEAVRETGKTWGYPLMLKSRRLAYDGRGNAVVGCEADIPAAWDVLAPKGDLYVERWVPFVKELAVIVVCGRDGRCVSYPAVETVQRDSICHLVIAPAPISGKLLYEAGRVAQKAVGACRGAGVFGVELFLTAVGEVLFNEVAPRVHNSGHFTIEACECSQFEQHVRAVMGLPLGSVRMRVPAAVMVNILGVGDEEGDMDGPTWRFAQRALAIPGASLHWYGKTGVKRNRKMGHITVTGESMMEVKRRVAGLWAHARGDVSPASGALSPATASMPAIVAAPLVGIIMGSDSDLPTMAGAAAVLADFGIPHEVTIVSAHRTPARLTEYATTARERGLKVIIAGAGGAAHLPGMVASLTPLPVIGVPIPLKYLDGMDSLMSIVQMPKGIPVATVAIGNAANAGLLAARILGVTASHLADACEAYQSGLEEEVLAKAGRLEAMGVAAYLARNTGAGAAAGGGTTHPAASLEGNR